MTKDHPFVSRELAYAVGEHNIVPMILKQIASNEQLTIWNYDGLQQ